MPDMPPTQQKRRPLRKTHLRTWRLFKNLTQEQAAERIGIDYTTLGRIERGLVPYSQALLEAAAEAYGCEPWDLLNVDPTKEREVIDLTSLLKHATPEDRQAIIGFARGRLSRN